jgi:hypothetical protein
LCRGLIADEEAKNDQGHGRNQFHLISPESSFSSFGRQGKPCGLRVTHS